MRTGTKLVGLFLQEFQIRNVFINKEKEATSNSDC